VGLGFHVKRGSKSVGIGGSIIVLLIYYGLLMFAVSLASQNVFSPLVLTWIPNAVMLAAGAGLWHRLAKQ
jgi:lipopolysaccharide export LptBFGC system permease protein LptF